MSEHADQIKKWVDSFRHDVAVMEAVVSASGADRRARKLAAGALGYLVSRMDLVPDWNETIGVIDDVMVLRVCMDLAGAPEKGLEPDVATRVAALADDVAVIEAVLGEDLYAKLRAYCGTLPGTEVRGRSPDAVIDDMAVRKALFAEVQDDIARIPAASFANADDVLARFTSYLHQKLI